jgi:hypothetical protein
MDAVVEANLLDGVRQLLHYKQPAMQKAKLAHCTDIYHPGAGGGWYETLRSKRFRGPK